MTKYAATPTKTERDFGEDEIIVSRDWRRVIMANSLPSMVT
jgi:hypothetical protein